ncbi:MAG: GerMN domain-containing protein [Spirochaetaceae bacterium]
MNKKRIIVTSILIISFIVSFIMFQLNEQRYTKITFRYFYELEDKIILEDRYILLNGTLEEKAEQIVKELFLGPISVFNKKLVPFDFKYNSFYTNNKIAYLDLPSSFIKNNNDIDIIISLIKENILSNLNKINTVIITVDGYLLGDGPLAKELPQGEIDNKK